MRNEIAQVFFALEMRLAITIFEKNAIWSCDISSFGHNALSALIDSDFEYGEAKKGICSLFFILFPGIFTLFSQTEPTSVPDIVRKIVAGSKKSSHKIRSSASGIFTICHHHGEVSYDATQFLVSCWRVFPPTLRSRDFIL